jgi:hypothetical protein
MNKLDLPVGKVELKQLLGAENAVGCQRFGHAFNVGVVSLQGENAS